MAEYRRKKREAQEVLRKTEAIRQGESMVGEALQKILDEIPVKRRRGRPTGSKNKKKTK